MLRTYPIRMIAIALLTLTGSNAFGGVVSFTPNEILHFGWQTHTTASMELAIESSAFEEFEAVDIIVGSNDGVRIVDFEWAEFTRFFSSSEPDTSVYASGWRLGYFALPTSSAPFLLGTLTIDFSGLPGGSYFIEVDSDRDGGRSSLASGNELEPLFGFAVVYAGIPEPSTMFLLLFGAGIVAMARRSRTGHRPGTAS